MPTTKPPTILALDPGLRELGFAILQGNRFVAGGVIPLCLLPRADRLPEARARIAALVSLHQPRGIVVEKTYRHPVPWLDELHEITLYARRLARKHRLHFATYAPQAVRQGVVGNGKARKHEVAVAVSLRIRQLRVHLTQDRRWKESYWYNLFDAVALGLHHQAQDNPPSRSR